MAVGQGRGRRTRSSGGAGTSPRRVPSPEGHTSTAAIEKSGSPSRQKLRSSSGPDMEAPPGCGVLRGFSDGSAQGAVAEIPPVTWGFRYGGVAQLVERLTGSQEVRGFESHRLHSQTPGNTAFEPPKGHLCARPRSSWVKPHVVGTNVNIQMAKGHSEDDSEKGAPVGLRFRPHGLPLDAVFSLPRIPNGQESSLRKPEIEIRDVRGESNGVFHDDGV